MPQRDKTGPQGKGPKTGRSQGDCSTKEQLRVRDDVQQRVDQNAPGRARRQPRNQINSTR